MAVDAEGQPVRFILTGGEASDFTQAIPLLAGIDAEGVIADKGYDSDEILEFAKAKGARAVIPPKSNRLFQREYDRQAYRLRNLVERAINKPKQWRRIATRYDRRSLYFLSSIYLAAAITWST